MKYLKRLFLCLIIVFSFSLIACGEESEGTGVGNESDGNNVVIETSRKIYYTVDISITSDNANQHIQSIMKLVLEYDGYAPISNIQYDEKNNAKGKIIYKIPTSKLNQFLDYIDGLNGVKSKNIQATDITSKYNETTARIETLTASKEAYVELLKTVNDYSSIITIKTRIEEIDTELTKLQKEKESYDNLLDYSTVTIYYNTDDYAEKSFGEEYGDYLANFFTFIFKAIMYLLPIACLGGVGILVALGLSKLGKKIKEKHNKKE